MGENILDTERLPSDAQVPEADAADELAHAAAFVERLVASVVQ